MTVLPVVDSAATLQPSSKSAAVSQSSSAEAAKMSLLALYLPNVTVSIPCSSSSGVS